MLVESRRNSFSRNDWSVVASTTKTTFWRWTDLRSCSSSYREPRFVGAKLRKSMSTASLRLASRRIVICQVSPWQKNSFTR